MDSLPEAFIHPPEPLCEERFITDACTLFHVFWTVTKTPAFPIERLGGATTIFNITPIGFVWKKKVT